MIHILKTWPIYFQKVKSNEKPYELRFNDRDYQVGDILILKEWDPESQLFTGDSCRRFVTFMGESCEEIPGLQPGWVILGLNENDILAH